MAEHRPTGRSRGRPRTTAGRTREIETRARAVWGQEWAPAALDICEQVAGGASLTKACSKYTSIDPPLFLRWVEEQPVLRKEWDRAKLSRAAGLFEEIAELAHELREIGTAVEGLDEKRRAFVEAADLFKWAAGKLDPQSFGDRAQPGSGIAIHINTSLPLAADALDDGSGSFTVRVGPDPAPETRTTKGSGATPVKSAADPETETEWQDYAPETEPAP